ncbi:putative membrane protein C6F6.13c [Cladobotryum mycophilum]|uniref:Membrane protein C6F6.13c n=1 Tax=Cladobotryum mycophilum TaxID=491253 RepID=A0ABR0SYF5_9HYPO
MARGGRGGSHAPRRPVDLTGIISAAEKNDLVNLVTAITEKMGRDISDIFDSPPITPIQGDRDHNHWLMLPLINDKENQPSPLQKMNKANAAKPLNKNPPIVEKEDKDAMTPQLRELKKEALLFFRKWQSNVLQRIRDIVVNETVIFHPSARGRGRGAPRGSIRGRGRGGGTGRGNLSLATGPPRAPSNHVDRALALRFAPMPNPLWTLDMEKRKLLLHIVFLVLLSLQEFTANARLLLLNLTSALNLSPKVLQDDEVRLARGLAKTAIDVPLEEALALKPEENKSLRRWKLGLSNAVGTTVKLAAPLSAVGIGTAHSGLGLTSSAAAGLLGTMAENGILMGSVFGINAAKPTIKMMESFAREIQDFAFLPLHTPASTEYLDAREIPAEYRRLRLVITMNGFLADAEDVVKPWRCLGRLAETFAIRWETSVLVNLGNSLETVIKSSAWGSAKEEIKARTIFSSLIDSVWPTPLMKISKIMDNPWSVGMVRAEKAGAVLADAIMRQKFQGDRPISLIGYSLASRAIYTCLMVLAERRQFGLIDSVVMIGTPAPSESRVWLTLKSVVCGRLVNVYSEHDYILGFLYRTSNIQFGVAGLQEVQGAEGVENHRIRTLPKGHLSYQNLVGQILKDIGWEDLDMNVIKAEKLISLGK